MLEYVVPWLDFPLFYFPLNVIVFCKCVLQKQILQPWCPRHTHTPECHLMGRQWEEKDKETRHPTWKRTIPAQLYLLWLFVPSPFPQDKQFYSDRFNLVAATIYNSHSWLNGKNTQTAALWSTTSALCQKKVLIFGVPLNSIGADGGYLCSLTVSDLEVAWFLRSLGIGSVISLL